MVAKEKKVQYFEKMMSFLDKYTKCVFVTCNNVGSNQIQKVRKSLRGEADILAGKNTLMLKCLNTYLADHPDSPYEAIRPLIRGNCALIFTNGDINKIRDTIEENRVPAAAKTGAIAECDVIVPPGPTGCDPGQTSWFQALNVPTKISRGQIEIISELLLIKKGDKVGASEAGLLQKLDIRPFTYGLILSDIYDNGTTYAAAVLDITDDVLKAKLITTIRDMAAVSMSVGYPTLASLPHVIGKAARDLIAICSIVDYKFKYTEPWDALFNMSEEELAALKATQQNTTADGDGGAAAEEEKEEEAEIDMGGGGALFGDDEGY